MAGDYNPLYGPFGESWVNQPRPRFGTSQQDVVLDDEASSLVIEFKNAENWNKQAARASLAQLDRYVSDLGKSGVTPVLVLSTPSGAADDLDWLEAEASSLGVHLVWGLESARAFVAELSTSERSRLALHLAGVVATGANAVREISAGEPTGAMLAVVAWLIALGWLLHALGEVLAEDDTARPGGR